MGALPPRSLEDVSCEADQDQITQMELRMDKCCRKRLAGDLGPGGQGLAQGHTANYQQDHTSDPVK